MRTLLATGSCCAALILTGCNQNLDLAAVQNMAATSAGSKAAFDAISADFYDSCVRRQRFLNNFDLTACASQQKASQAWQGANSMLLAYFNDLGSLATDKQTDFGLSDLAKSVASIKGVAFNGTQQTAVVDAAKGLVSGFFAGQRRGDLAKIMTHAEQPDPAHGCPDGCLSATVKALASIAQDEYESTMLAAEDTQIQLFYTYNISLAETVPKPLPALAGAPSPTAVAEGQTLASLGAVGRLIALGYYTDEANTRAAIATKRAAVSQYVSSLNELVAAHHKIVEAINDDKPDQIVGIVHAFIATYSADLSAVRKAFP